jgi:hypothetical protein
MSDESPSAVPAPPPLEPPPVKARGGGLNRRAGMIITTAGLLVGGLTGGYIIGHAATSSTATPSPSASSGSGSGSSNSTAPNGVFHPNEDPTHEAGESAQREAQENAGQVPTVP